MSEIIFPKLDELYTAITKDCYNYLYLSCSEQVQKSIDNILISQKGRSDIYNQLYVIKYYIAKNKSKYKNYSDIIRFVSKYIDIMFAFFSKEQIAIIDVKFYYEYCLAYIVLVGYGYILNNSLNDDKLFIFEVGEYDYFSCLLSKYGLFVKLRNFYEQCSSALRNINDKYFNLIAAFDKDYLFILDMAIEKEERCDSSKGSDLDSTKDNSGKKGNSKNEIKEKEEAKEGNENKDINNNLNINITNYNNDSNDSEKEINLNETFSKINELNIDQKNVEPSHDLIPENVKNEIKLHKDEENTKNNVNKQNIYETVFNIQKELEVNKKVKSFEKEMEANRIKAETTEIKLEIEMIEIKFKWLETNEKLNYESIFNSLYLNAAKKNVEYLEQYIKSLRNTITNLSNPYNFNFWRKLSNIILKNLLIILNNKNFIINQSKNPKLLNLIRKKFKDGNIFIDSKINKKINDYKNGIKDEKKIKTENISNAADKERTFNLITINKEEKPDVTASLTIDFLFYLIGNVVERGTETKKEEQNVIENILENNKIVSKEQNEIKIETEKKEVNNVNMEQKEEKIYKGDELIELIQMLKNPLYFQQKNTKNKNLFDSIYEKINSVKNSIENKNNNEQKIAFIQEAKKIKSKIIDLTKIIENFFEIKKIVIKAIENKKKVENYDEDTNKRINIYNELKQMEIKINKKLELYEENNTMLKELNASITNKEKEISEEINILKEKIDDLAKLVKIEKIFNEYKLELKTQIKSEQEYKTHKDIFNDNNVDGFKIDDLFAFLKEHLKDYTFSLTKRDITNYNLFVEVITTFTELMIIYENNVDVKLKVNDDNKDNKSENNNVIGIKKNK
jgi:hypothetical protein